MDLGNGRGRVSCSTGQFALCELGNVVVGRLQEKRKEPNPTKICACFERKNRVLGSFGKIVLMQTARSSTARLTGMENSFSKTFFRL